MPSSKSGCDSASVPFRGRDGVFYRDGRLTDFFYMCRGEESKTDGPTKDPGDELSIIYEYYVLHPDEIRITLPLPAKDVISIFIKKFVGRSNH